MKLTGHHIIPPNTRYKPRSIVRRGCRNSLVRRIDIERMHKIPVGPVDNSFEEGTRPLQHDVIPTHVRYLQLHIWSKPSDGAGNNPETLMSPKLLTFLKQQLEPQADSQKWFPRLNRRANRFCHSVPFNVGHAISKGTNPGQYDMTRIANHVRITRLHRLMPHRLEGFGDTAKIAHTVVDDGDHGCLPSNEEVTIPQPE